MASNRRKRERREAEEMADARPAVTPPQPRVRPAPPRDLSRPSMARVGRSTYRVANAMREITAALPDVIYQKTPPPAVRRQIEQPLGDLGGAKVGQVTARRAAKPAVRDPLKLQENRPSTCKPRPMSSKGDGSGRPFVPWCKRK